MAAPWLAILVKTVPWVELARRTPEIIEGSRRLLEKSRSAAETQSGGRPLGVEELTERIRLLEQRDVEHARVVEQVVEQLQGLTDALQVVETRNRRLSWLLAAVVVLAVAAAGVALLG
jgi:hypothetical protein